MSTRSNIILTDGVSIDNKKVILYYGHDSYPEWLGVVLANVCKALAEKYWFFEPEELATMLVKYGVEVEKDGKKKLYNDFRISSKAGGCIQYIYTINCDASHDIRQWPHGYLLHASSISCGCGEPDWESKEDIPNKDILYTSPYFDKVSIEHWWEKEPEIQQTEEQLKTLNSNL